MANLDDGLTGTPYLIPEDQESRSQFARTAQRSEEVALRARQVRQRIANEAEGLLQPFLHAQRSDLVAESNQIEGYDVTRDHVLEAVNTHRELVNGEVHGLMEAMRADPKIVNALGLYKAQQLADDWANSGNRPRAFEMRQLHALLVVDQKIGGRFRAHDVAIGGATFRPPAHYNVPTAMDQFAAWWAESSGDPVLDATVAHAWLTHIHPYEDGNGRLARILANFALAQAHFPPLVVRAEADRGEYYAALAESDGGNILPLYTLFAQIIRRTVKVMSKPGYTQDYLENRLLSSLDDQRSAWIATLLQFETHFSAALEPFGWTAHRQGLPSRESFQLLCDGSADGNGWFSVIRDEHGRNQWLLWFGYTSQELTNSLSRQEAGYPSIKISRRDERPGALHPFLWTSAETVPDELYLRPLDPQPVFWREGSFVDTYAVTEGANRLATSLASTI